MKNFRKSVLVCLVCCFLSGCLGYETLIRNFLPPEIDQFSREVIGMAKERNWNGILMWLDDSIKSGEAKATFLKIFDYMDRGEIAEIITTGVHVHRFENTVTYSITYQLTYPEHFQVVNMVVADSGGGPLVKGFHVNDIPDSLDRLNRFTFKGKSYSHYLFLGLNVLYIGFIVLAFVVCLRTRNLKRKWLWAIISLLGAGEILFNWTTGAWQFKLLNFGFNISAFMPATPYTAVILKFYIPVGGILFFIKRLTLTRG